MKIVSASVLGLFFHGKLSAKGLLAEMCPGQMIGEKLFEEIPPWQTAAKSLNVASCRRRFSLSRLIGGCPFARVFEKRSGKAKPLASSPRKRGSIPP